MGGARVQGAETFERIVQREHFERDRGAMTGRFVKGHPVTAIQTLAGGATPRVVHEYLAHGARPDVEKVGAIDPGEA